MSVELLIRDGSPYWYLSPDIWVVPGNDPTGPAGNPVAGQPAYLWAHVANTGNTDATGVRVDFYWANPALHVLRSNATLVGSAFADLPAGGSQDALCLVTWVPVMVNGGHECLVAVANHPADSLPDPPPDDFNPPAYPQVAQRNLSVLAASMHALAHVITISGRRRSDKVAVVTAEVGGELDQVTLGRLGLKGLRQAKKAVVEVGLAREPRCPGEKDPLGPNRMEVRVPKGQSTAVFAAIRARDLAQGEYQLVHLAERDGDQVVGGLAFVIVPER